MGILESLLYTFDSLTGRGRRHNKALRDVTEWSSTIQEFFTEYNLNEEDSKFDSILENTGKVQFELIAITHKARGIIKTAQNIKGVKVSLLVNKILDELDNARRALINPALSHPNLIKAITELRSSFRKLKDTISEIEHGLNI